MCGCGLLTPFESSQCAYARIPCQKHADRVPGSNYSIPRDLVYLGRVTDYLRDLLEREKSPGGGFVEGLPYNFPQIAATILSG